LNTNIERAGKVLSSIVDVKDLVSIQKWLKNTNFQFQNSTAPYLSIMPTDCETKTDPSRVLNPNQRTYQTNRLWSNEFRKQRDLSRTQLAQKHNPSIDWKDGSLIFDRCPTACKMSKPTSKPSKETKTQEVHLEDEDHILMIDSNPALNIQARSNITTELATKENQKKEQKPLK
jgi:hypothetical protein